MVQKYPSHRMRLETPRTRPRPATGTERPKTCDFRKPGGLYASGSRCTQRQLKAFISPVGVLQGVNETGIRGRVSRVGRGRIRSPHTRGMPQVASVGFENKEHRS
jgi:hypothetical protein